MIAGKREATLHRLEVIGMRIGRPQQARHAIKYDGLQIGLTPCSFRYLFALVYGRIANAQDGGWIHRLDIDTVADNQARYLYRLAREIEREFGKQPIGWWPIYENDRSGYYRLAGEFDFTNKDFDFEELAIFPDHRVRTLAKELKFELRKRR